MQTRSRARTSARSRTKSEKSSLDDLHAIRTRTSWTRSLRSTRKRHPAQEENIYRREYGTRRDRSIKKVQECCNLSLRSTRKAPTKVSPLGSKPAVAPAHMIETSPFPVATTVPTTSRTLALNDSLLLLDVSTTSTEIGRSEIAHRGLGWPVVTGALPDTLVQAIQGIILPRKHYLELIEHIMKHERGAFKHSKTIHGLLWWARRTACRILLNPNGLETALWWLNDRVADVCKRWITLANLSRSVESSLLTKVDEARRARDSSRHLKVDKQLYTEEQRECQFLEVCLDECSLKAAAASFPSANNSRSEEVKVLEQFAAVLSHNLDEVPRQRIVEPKADVWTIAACMFLVASPVLELPLDKQLDFMRGKTGLVTVACVSDIAVLQRQVYNIEIY